MATDLRNLPAFFNTDADFRSWIDGLRAQITALGIVRLIGVGEVNTATVTKPAAINTAQGYDVFRFDDGLQATSPVFIKLEYGCPSVIDRPGLWLTTGSSHNGSGLLLGQTGVRAQAGAGQSKAAGVVAPSYCSGSTSRMTLLTNMDPSSANFGLLVHVERPRDAAGVEQGDCWLSMLASANNSYRSQMVPTIGTIPGAATTGNAIVTNSQGNQSVKGANVALTPLTVVYAHLLWSVLLYYWHLDVGELVAITTTHFGVHTYMPMGDGTPSASNMNGANSIGYALAIPWE